MAEEPKKPFRKYSAPFQPHVPERPPCHQDVRVPYPPKTSGLTQRLIHPKTPPKPRPIVRIIIYAVLWSVSVARAQQVNAPWGGEPAAPFGGYVQIQDEGISLALRDVLNFIGTGVLCVDNPTNRRTDCVVTGGGGGGGITSLTCGAGMSCTPSNPITTSGTVKTASQTAGFLNDGGVSNLTCGASNQGKSQVMDAGVLQYCDGATTSVLQTAALGNSTGQATSVSDGNRGDVTISGGIWGITPGVVQNSDMVNMPAHTHKGNNTGATGPVLDLTQAQLTADLNQFTPALQGVVPNSGGGTTNFLRADGTWVAPPGSTTNLLNSVQHLDTTTANVSRGDLVTGQGTGPTTWTRLPKGSASQVLQMDGTGTDIVWGAASTFNGALLNTSLFNDVTAAGPTRGDLITGQGATPKWQRLAKGTAGQCLQMDGTATDIAWGSCAGGASNHNLLSATHPDTVPSSPVRGGMIVANSTPAWAQVAKGSAFQVWR